MRFLEVRIPHIKKIASEKFEDGCLEALLSSDVFEFHCVALHHVLRHRLHTPQVLDLLLLTKSAWLENWAIADDYAKVINEALFAGEISECDVPNNFCVTVMERRVSIVCWLRYNSRKVFRCDTAMDIYRKEQLSKEHYVAKAIKWFDRDYIGFER